MSLLLHIDTATETALVSLAQDGNFLAGKKNTDQKTHATFLHTAIKLLTDENNISLREIDAVAVVAGPGSYTGLRVGMATAKGLCYALGKPLILLNTLTVMAKSMMMAIEDLTASKLYCPMIDARRMEVYTAVYDRQLSPVLSPAPVILNPDSFHKLLQTREMIFSGNGTPKFKEMLQHENASFANLPDTSEAVCLLAEQAYIAADFADLAHSQPFYLKDFHSSPDLPLK